MFRLFPLLPFVLFPSPALAQATQPPEPIKGVSPITITLIVIVGSSFLAY